MTVFPVVTGFLYRLRTQTIIRQKVYSKEIEKGDCGPCGRPDKSFFRLCRMFFFFFFFEILSELQPSGTYSPCRRESNAFAEVDRYHLVQVRQNLKKKKKRTSHNIRYRKAKALSVSIPRLLTALRDFHSYCPCVFVGSVLGFAVMSSSASPVSCSLAIGRLRWIISCVYVRVYGMPVLGFTVDRF